MEGITMFEHRLSDPHGETDPGNDLTLIDNLGATLDRVIGLADFLQRIEADDDQLQAGSYHQVALACRTEAQDAKALLSYWHEAKRHGAAFQKAADKREAEEAQRAGN